MVRRVEKLMYYLGILGGNREEICWSINIWVILLCAMGEAYDTWKTLLKPLKCRSQSYWFVFMMYLQSIWANRQRNIRSVCRAWHWAVSYIEVVPEPNNVLISMSKNLPLKSLWGSKSSWMMLQIIISKNVSQNLNNEY